MYRSLLCGLAGHKCGEPGLQARHRNESGFCRGRTTLRNPSLLLFLISAALTALALGQQAGFRNAPASAAAMKNPYEHSASAAAEGQKVYAQNCAQCHGKDLRGMGPAPALDTPPVHNAKPGELFWFVTNGKPDSGMPAWTSLPKNQRWEIVSYLQGTKATKSAAK
jgi:mono/diheme cytochrome c family protein